MLCVGGIYMHAADDLILQMNLQVQSGRGFCADVASGAVSVPCTTTQSPDRFLREPLESDVVQVCNLSQVEIDD